MSGTDDISLPDTILRRASADQHRITWRATYEAWGKPCGLSLEQYLRREEELSKTRHAVDGLVAWVLVPKDDPDTTVRMLSHCETLRRPALVSPSKPASREPGNSVEDTHVMSVASVFTPERYRRKGYARRMLALLKEEMQKDAGVSFSTLFSDVGRTYYESLGWQVYPSREFSLVASKACVDLLGELSANNETCAMGPQLLKRGELSETADQDCLLIRSEMTIRSLEPACLEHPAVAVLPTADIYEWFCARMSAHGVKPDVPVGVRCISGGGDALQAAVSFATWYVDLHAKKMTLLRLRHGSSEELAVVLRAAVTVASDLGLDTVVGWCPLEDAALQRFCSQIASRASSLAALTDRDGSLPSLAAWGPAGAVGSARKVEWLHCEGYGWV